MAASATDLFGHAWKALGSGDFQGAVEQVRASIEMEPTPLALDMYANLLFAEDELDEARLQWEHAFRLFRQVGENGRAIRTAANLAIMHSGLGNDAAARGWINRARRLSESVGRCVERGYLELALVACDVRDATALESAAEIALELAIEFDDPNLEARALADGGLALISQGRLSEGFGRLDEAMAPLSAGEVTDPGMAGTIFCAMLTACERTGDVRRAEEWTRTCGVYRDARMFGKFPVLHTHCRIAYGRVLCDAGRLEEAESELAESLGSRGTAFVPKQAEAAAVFAGLRLLQGRFEDAEATLAPYLDRFEVCEPLARLHLARGEPDLAVATIVRALHDLVGDRLRGGPLLGLLVEVELARDNIEGAMQSAKRLGAYAQEAESSVLAAEAHLAHGRCAMRQGAVEEAVTAFSAARRELGDNQRPVLAGRIRLELARSTAACGRTAESIDEARAALAVFDRLGASRYADEAAALLRELGAPGRSRGKASADVGSLTSREREVFELIGQGLTNAEIASRLFITPKTAEHHVGRVLAKLGVRSRTEAAAVAASDQT